MIKQIRILGLDYEVELFTDRKGITGAGQINLQQHLIQINEETNSPVHAKSVLIHEIIEALNYRLELKLEHNVITSLETGLFQVFQDNPEFLKIFLGVADSCSKPQ